MPGSKLSGFSLEGFGVNVRVETGGAGNVMVVGTGLLLVIPDLGLGLLARSPGTGLLVALTAVTGLGLFLTITGVEVLAVVTRLELFTSTIRFELLITCGGLGLLDILEVITGEEAFGTTGGLFLATEMGLESKFNAGGLEVFADGSGDKQDSGAGLFVLETTRNFSE